VSTGPVRCWEHSAVCLGRGRIPGLSLNTQIRSWVQSGSDQQLPPRPAPPRPAPPCPALPRPASPRAGPPRAAAPRPAPPRAAPRCPAPPRPGAERRSAMPGPESAAHAVTAAGDRRTDRVGVRRRRVRDHRAEPVAGSGRRGDEFRDGVHAAMPFVFHVKQRFTSCSARSGGPHSRHGYRVRLVKLCIVTLLDHQIRGRERGSA
jgi:hypothetical protein